MPARCACTCARRPARRLEETQRYFAEVESAIRQIVGDDQIDVMLDNIGLPYSGINIALSDSATVGPMDGEILISLKEKHTPTAAHVADLRRELPKRFPELQFFFQPADIVDQVLNFGQPAPIDIRDFRARTATTAYALAPKIARDLNAGSRRGRLARVPGSRRAGADRRRRSHAGQQIGMTQRDSRQQRAGRPPTRAPRPRPNFWVDPTQQRELSAGRADADLSRRTRRRTWRRCRCSRRRPASRASC